MTSSFDGAPSGAEPSAPTEPPTPPDDGPPPAEPTSPTASTRSRPTTHPVEYKGAELDPERGPGLGCFRFQLVTLVVLLVVTPLGVNAGWPDWLTTILLFVTLALLLVAGQTIIFLLRLVAADRRSQRRPLASRTRTVGELTAVEPTAVEPTAAGDEPSDAEPAVDEPADRDEPSDEANGPRRDDPIDGQGDGDPSVRQ